MPYTLHTHRHNFACWTAARAMARNFTSTEHVASATQASKLRSSCDTDANFGSKGVFDGWHHIQCHAVLTHWQTITGHPPKNPSYGRAAKAVALYLKTSIGMQARGSHSAQRYLHPPIDQVLSMGMRRELAYTIATLPKWMQLGRGEYRELVRRLDAWVGKEAGRERWMAEASWVPGEAD